MATSNCPECGAKIDKGSVYCKSCGADLKEQGEKRQYVEREWFFFAYLFEFVSGILIYFAKGQNNKRLAFHAAQSTTVGLIGFVLSIIFPIGWIISLAAWVLCLYLGIEAYNGRDTIVPIIGPFLASSISYSLKGTKSKK